MNLAGRLLRIVAEAQASGEIAPNVASQIRLALKPQAEIYAQAYLRRKLYAEIHGLPLHVAINRAVADFATAVDDVATLCRQVTHPTGMTFAALKKLAPSLEQTDVFNESTK